MSTEVQREVTVYTEQYPEGLLFKNVTDATGDSTGFTIEEEVNGNSFMDFFPMHAIHRVESAILNVDDEDEKEESA